MCKRALYFFEVITLKRKSYFSLGERILWIGSAAVIVLFFILFDKENYLTLAASLIGVTSLIFNAKANPIGQALMIVFSILYGIISYSFRYYGEMITYLGMTMPMAILSLAAWLRHPFESSRSEIAINRIGKKEWLLMTVLAASVTAVFGFLLRAFNTANLAFSTVSVTTSFIAVYLTLRRDPFYAAGYAANDIVLIILWTLASAEEPRYISVTVCFAAFLINDIYGFINWRKILRKQQLMS